MKLLRAVLPVFAVALVCSAAPAWAADVDFEPVPLGTTPDVQEIEFVNDGAEDIVLRDAAIVGADAGSFAVEEDLCNDIELWHGHGCIVRIRFDPRRVGLNQATVQIPMDGSAEPVTATLAGEGRESVRVSPGVVDFGTFAGFRGSRQVSVQNVSAEPIDLDVSLAQWRSGFTTDHGCRWLLPPGGACTLTIYATGFDLGTFTNTLLVQHGSIVLASAPVRATRVPRTPPSPPKPPPSPDATAAVQARLAGALKGWRKLGRAGLRKRGFAISGFKPPADGDAYLLIRSGKRVVADEVFMLEVGKPAKLRVRPTRAGRRLLAGKKAIKLDVVLRFVAASDSRVSRVQRTLRLPAR